MTNGGVNAPRTFSASAAACRRDVDHLDQRELVAAEPAQRVAGAQEGGDPDGDLAQQPVAGRVPEAYRSHP